MLLVARAVVVGLAVLLVFPKYNPQLFFQISVLKLKRDQGFTNEIIFLFQFEQPVILSYQSGVVVNQLGNDIFCS